MVRPQFSRGGKNKMKLAIISKQSYKAIFANKGRSILTILGIVIGIGSVIALIALGNGVKANITKQISTLGTTTLTVTPGAELSQVTSGNSGSNTGGSSGQKFGGGGGGGAGFGDTTSTLTVADYTSLQDKTKNPDIKLAAGLVNSSAIYQDTRYLVVASGPSLFQIRERSIQTGRFFTDDDVTNKNKVIDLGYDVSQNLFKDVNPIGQTLKIGNDDYSVIGVIAQTTETSIQNPNTNVYAPYTSVMSSIGTDRFSSISVMANDEGSVDRAKTEIQNTIMKNHNITDLKLADFSVSTPADLLSTVGNITGILTSLLSGIAAISLLVGGIGIMNIMLVSVTERTREIGLRKAVGAKVSDILVQFLIEAVFLTVIGGLIGIALGYAMAEIAGRFIGFAPVVTTSAIVLAVGISTLIGLVFGSYPALKAARLNPIDALRYE